MRQRKNLKHPGGAIFMGGKVAEIGPAMNNGEWHLVGIESAIVIGVYSTFRLPSRITRSADANTEHKSSLVQSVLTTHDQKSSNTTTPDFFFA
jgi:hypothetical protein